MSTLVMGQSERSRRWDVSTAMGLLGLGGAWLAADYFRMGATSDGPRARGLLVTLTAIASFAMGALAATRKTFFNSALALILVGPPVGAFVGVLVRSLSSTPSPAGYELNSAALDGFVTGAGFLPAMLMVLFASRHVGRARAGSLVDDADRRSAYVATALAIALGVPIAVRGCAMALWFTVPLDMTLACGTMACVGLFALAAADGIALRRGRACLSDFDTLEPREAEATEPFEGCDLGLGAEELVRVERADAYRAKPVVVFAVKGDPQTSLSVLGGAFARSAIAWGIATAAVLVGFQTERMQETSFSELARQAATDRAIAMTRDRPAGQGLPLACEAYFTLAGGCVERLTPGADALHMGHRLDRVRSDWVTGADRAEISSACTAGLQDALNQPVCVSAR